MSPIEFDAFYEGSFIPFLLEEATVVPCIFHRMKLSIVARFVLGGVWNVSVGQFVIMKESVVHACHAKDSITNGVQTGSVIGRNGKRCKGTLMDYIYE